MATFVVGWYRKLWFSQSGLEAEPKEEEEQVHDTGPSDKMKMWTKWAFGSALLSVMASFPLINADVDEWPSVENDHTKLQVVLPESLQKKDGYQHKDALFGYPAYSIGSLQTQLIYTNSTGCSKIPTGNWEPPFALLIDRGECHFVEKVRRAQHAGARAVLIADDKCLCSDTECLKSTGDDFCETVLPYMADDESGGDISIPSMLIRKSDAFAIKDQISHSKGVSNVMVKFDWGIPSPDGRVEWTLWHSSWDDMSAATLGDLQDVVMAMGDRAFFTPRFVSYNGSRVGCHFDDEDIGQACGNMCLNNGRYCLLDPSPFHDREAGASGADVVVENLRRICIWKSATKDEPGVGSKWWHYVKDSTTECGQDEDLFKEKKCAIKVMKKHGIDVDEIEKCMQPYGINVDEVNPLLEEELKQQTALQILRLPAVYVDGVHARGRIDASNILSMICAGFGPHDPPAICSCSNQLGTGLAACIKVGGASNAAVVNGGAGYSFGSMLVLMLFVVGAVSTAGFVYWKRTQRHMREQVRSILAEYMPLEDQSTMEDEELEGLTGRMHPAALASAKSPRGYLPTREFLDENDEDGV